MNPGQVLRLKPRGSDRNLAATQSQSEACQRLSNWGIRHERSERYKRAWEKSCKELCEQQDAERSRRRETYLPILKRIENDFPRLTKFLRKNLDIIEGLGHPATPTELGELEERLGAWLPPSYRQFLLHARTLELGDVLKFGLTPRDNFASPNIMQARLLSRRPGFARHGFLGRDRHTKRRHRRRPHVIQGDHPFLGM